MGLEMTNMKILKKSGKKTVGFMTNSGGYPYGLTISLDKDVIRKLELEAEDLIVGDSIRFCITARVTSTSIEADTQDISRCELQITDMCEMEDENEGVTYSLVPPLKTQGKKKGDSWE